MFETFSLRMRIRVFRETSTKKLGAEGWKHPYKKQKGGNEGELACCFGNHSPELPIIKFVLGRFANFFVFLLVAYINHLQTSIEKFRGEVEARTDSPTLPSWLLYYLLVSSLLLDSKHNIVRNQLKVCFLYHSANLVTTTCIIIWGRQGVA